MINQSHILRRRLAVTRREQVSGDYLEARGFSEALTQSFELFCPAGRPHQATHVAEAPDQKSLDHAVPDKPSGPGHQYRITQFHDGVSRFHFLFSVSLPD